mgnify:CR=1 FL=1
MRPSHRNQLASKRQALTGMKFPHMEWLSWQYKRASYDEVLCWRKCRCAGWNLLVLRFIRWGILTDKVQHSIFIKNDFNLIFNCNFIFFILTGNTFRVFQQEHSKYPTRLMDKIPLNQFQYQPCLLYCLADFCALNQFDC